MTRFWRILYLQKAALKVLYFLFGIVIVLPFILFVILQLPIFLYRWLLVKIAVPMLPPKYGKMVTVNAQFQATELHGPPQTSKFGLVLKMVLTGHLTHEELLKLVLQRWILAKETNGQLRHPEFQQYISYKFGFMFWMNDPEFDLKNHVISSSLHGNVETKELEQCLHDLEEQLLNKPYSCTRSPWEIHLISLYANKEGENEAQTVLLFRFHHVLGDGIALMHVILEDLFRENLKNVQVAVPRMKIPSKMNFGGYFVRLGELVTLPFRLITDFGFVICTSLRFQYPWGHEHLKVGVSKQQIFARVLPISMERLKFIKNKFGVSLSALLLSSLGKALARNLEEESLNGRWNSVRTSMMLPVMGHRNKLRSNTRATMFDLPISTQLSPRERLTATEKNFQDSKQSFSPIFMNALFKTLSSSLAFPFANMVTSRSRALPVLSSNFPGPGVKFGLDAKRQVLSLNVAPATFNDIFFVMFSYDGYMNLTITAGNGVMDRKELETLVKWVGEEINNLYELSIN